MGRAVCSAQQRAVQRYRPAAPHPTLTRTDRTRLGLQGMQCDGRNRDSAMLHAGVAEVTRGRTDKESKALSAEVLRPSRVDPRYCGLPPHDPPLVPDGAAGGRCCLRVQTDALARVPPLPSTGTPRASVRTPPLGCGPLCRSRLCCDASRALAHSRAWRSVWCASCVVRVCRAR